MKKNKVLVIAIAGQSASGKTTTSQKIKNALKERNLKSEIIKLDDYYYPFSEYTLEERKKFNYDDPKSFDYELLIKHIQKLKEKGSCEIPVYDYINYTRSTVNQLIEDVEIIIIEGLYALYYEDLFENVDFPIYIDADSDQCLIRRIKRDVKDRGRTIESVEEDYFTKVKPMYMKYVRPTRNKANLILPNGTINTDTIEMIVQYLEQKTKKM